MKLKKKELLIFIVIFIIALAGLGVQLYLNSRVHYGSIQITARGKLYGEYSLGKDQIIDIDDTNRCEIKDGIARMTVATCPDQLCVHQPGIDGKYTGSLIVCLPNGVVIQGIAADDEADSTPHDFFATDGIAY